MTLQNDRKKVALQASKFEKELKKILDENLAEPLSLFINAILKEGIRVERERTIKLIDTMKGANIKEMKMLDKINDKDAIMMFGHLQSINCELDNILELLGDRI